MTIQVRNAELARLLAQDAALTQPTLATFILGATTLDSLSDVITTYATYGDYLRYYGTYSSYYQQITYWVNVPVDTLFEDIKTVNANNGQLLIGNGSGYSVNTLTAGTNVTIDNGPGTITINSTASGGATTLDDLTDVTITSATTGNFLRYNGTQWVNVDPTVYLQPLDADLTALAALATTGIVVRTGSGTFATRQLAAPAAGISISNPDGVSGNPTFALVNDLNGLEGLSSTGIAVRTATDTWTVRTLTAGSNISVTNGSGVSGNPTVTATPSGSDGEIQFNSSGSFGADAQFKWDLTNNYLSIFGSSSGAFTNSQPGIHMIAGDGMASGGRFPYLSWLSEDVSFTTQNPKLLASLVVTSTEEYAANTDSGTAMSFYLSPDNGGTSGTQAELVKMQGTNKTLSLYGGPGAANTGGGADFVMARLSAGLELVASTIVASDLFPGIKWMSTDSNLTTENPKLVAGITAIASETYDGNTDGGASVSIFTTNSTPGTTNTPIERLQVRQDGRVYISSPINSILNSAQLAVTQSSETGAIPVLSLRQVDVSEEFIYFRGASSNGVLTQSIVEDADVTTVTRVGWLKVFVNDDGNQLTDQAYYVPIVTLA